MKVAELMQSWVGKALIATALFAAGYYFPLFGPAGTSGPPASASSASPMGASAATSPR